MYAKEFPIEIPERKIKILKRKHRYIPSFVIDNTYTADIVNIDLISFSGF